MATPAASRRRLPLPVPERAPWRAIAFAAAVYLGHPPLWIAAFYLLLYGSDCLPEQRQGVPVMLEAGVALMVLGPLALRCLFNGAASDRTWSAAAAHPWRDRRNAMDLVAALSAIPLWMLGFYAFEGLVDEAALYLGPPWVFGFFVFVLSLFARDDVSLRWFVVSILHGVSVALSWKLLVGSIFAIGFGFCLPVPAG